MATVPSIVPRPKIRIRMHLACRILALLLVLGALLAVGVSTAAPASALTYARNAWWTNRPPYGATLSITPSGVAQAIGISAASGVWNNALSIAGVRPYTSAAYKSMFEQLQCHLLFRFKTPFNLDTWRPSVSWAAELRDRCNPLPGEKD
jgi:hypothetical protein